MATRVECRTCHRKKEVSATGTVLWRASAEVCLACHDKADAEQLKAYHANLKTLLAEIEAAVGSRPRGAARGHVGSRSCGGDHGPVGQAPGRSELPPGGQRRAQHPLRHHLDANAVGKGLGVLRRVEGRGAEGRTCRKCSSCTATGTPACTPKASARPAPSSSSAGSPAVNARNDSM